MFDNTRSSFFYSLHHRRGLVGVVALALGLLVVGRVAGDDWVELDEKSQMRVAREVIDSYHRNLAALDSLEYITYESFMETGNEQGSSAGTRATAYRTWWSKGDKENRKADRAIQEIFTIGDTRHGVKGLRGSAGPHAFAQLFTPEFAYIMDFPEKVAVPDSASATGWRVDQSYEAGNNREAFFILQNNSKHEWFGRTYLGHPLSWMNSMDMAPMLKQWTKIPSRRPAPSPGVTIRLFRSPDGSTLRYWREDKSSSDPDRKFISVYEFHIASGLCTRQATEDSSQPYDAHHQQATIEYVKTKDGKLIYLPNTAMVSWGNTAFGTERPDLEAARPAEAHRTVLSYAFEYVQAGSDLFSDEFFTPKGFVEHVGAPAIVCDNMQPVHMGGVGEPFPTENPQTFPVPAKDRGQIEHRRYAMMHDASTLPLFAAMSTGLFPYHPMPGLIPQPKSVGEPVLIEQ